MSFMPLTAATNSLLDACQIGFALGGRKKVDPCQLLAESALMELNGNGLDFPAAAKSVWSLGH